MTLVDQGEALLESIRTQLVPQPEVSFYPAEPPVECCAGCGTLVWWPGVLSPRLEDTWECAGPIDVDLYFRLAVCWPTVQDDGTFPQEEATAVGQKLVDDVGVVSRLLVDIACRDTHTMFVSAIIDQPKGGCVTATFRMRVVVT